MRRVSNIRAGFTLAECATHVAHCNNSRKQGFTLAEVLITLGIIGVVAAMTMPTLMNSTQGAQYKAAYKKALSAISQGVTLNVALDGGSFADTVAGDAGKTDKKNGADTVASILASRMNVVNNTTYANKGYTITGDIATGKHTCTADEITKDGVCKGKKANDVVSTGSFTPDTSLFFNDGSVFSFASSSKACSKDDNVANHTVCYGIIDVNGAKGPNKVVTCDSGTGTSAKPCTANNPTDVYIVEFYDQTILPATDAAKAVLYGK